VEQPPSAVLLSVALFTFGGFGISGNSGDFGNLFLICDHLR